MGKTKVLMVRHGETEWNVLCRFLGSKDLPLNEKGRRQAGYAKAALENEKLDVVYSSPMRRAYETAEIICSDRDIKIQTDDGLREIACGAWEGLNGHEVEEKFPGQIELWENVRQNFVLKAEIHLQKCRSVCWMLSGESFMRTEERRF